ncbi:MAG: restriction endonuclease subunit S [Nostoc sp.]|uniref:restriction endonuclease subunit S n=1 Tax=Nostoc sp. TaxID=1180 RepID=UPI002FF761C9
MIASFLDRKTAAIDTLIAKKQRLIQLLQEKRTALINQAVTKGLDPKVPMKDSGVPWIGRTPQHWGVKLFKRVTSRIEVGIAEAATHAYADQGVPIVRSANVRTNYIDLSDMAYIQRWFAEKNSSKYLHAGDILTVRTGANAGMTAVLPEELDHAQCFTLLIATPDSQQFPPFYSYYINSSFAQSFFAVEGWGSAQVNLSVPILQTLPIVEPPYKEQQEIVSFIQKSTGMIDKIVSKNKQTIKKLQEYRQSLITAAVTGKIDIREEVAA